MSDKAVADYDELTQEQKNTLEKGGTIEIDGEEYKRGLHLEVKVTRKDGTEEIY